MIAAWLLVGLPGSVGVALLIAGRRADRFAGLVAVAASALTVVLAVVAAAFVRGSSEIAFLPSGPLRLRLDGLAAGTAVTVAAIALAALVVAIPQITSGRWRFFGLMLVFVAAVDLTVLADTLPGLLAGWEAMGATSWALIAFYHRSPAARAGGLTALLTTRAADLGLYLAAGAAMAGTVDHASVHGGRLALGALPALSGPWLNLAAAGVLVAALGKAAQLPFSFWLSGAMEGPSPVSALLHSAAMVAMGGYLLLRVHPLLAVAGWAATAAAWTGAVTAVVLGAIAIGQRDLKQLLAASTAAQLGFVVLAAGVTAGSGAVSAGLAQLIAHAATKALLFLVAGVWLHALGTKQLSGLRGAARMWPVSGVAFVIGALSLAGLPPLSLWAAKDAVLANAEQQSLPLYLTGLAGAVLAAGYAGRALAFTLRAIPSDAGAGWDTEQKGTRSVTSMEKAPLVCLAAAAAALGVLELPPVAAAMARATGEAAHISPSWTGMLTSAALAAIVTAFAMRVGARDWSPQWARTWLGSTVAIRSGVVRPVLRLARVLAVADDRGLDRAVLATARRGRSLARAAARADDVGIDRIVTGLARGVRRAAGWAVRPQTGQVHQYLAQAAVLLAAAVVLLAVVR